MRIKKTLESHIDIELTVDSLIELLTAYKDIYPEYGELQIEMENYNEYSEISLVGYREETQEEKQDREAKATIRDRKQREYELRQYKMLQDKYGA